MSAESALSRILSEGPPRAGSCIVTIYGDVAVPRGGSLWMGNLVTICAELGLSETLVRTAVSRQVGAGQLEGTRQGRRSYYRLTRAAQVEFANASQLIFSRPQPPKGWIWIIGADGAPPHGFSEIAAGLWLGPDRPGDQAHGGSVMRAAVSGDLSAMGAFVARHWDLRRQAQSYSGFLARFGPLDGADLQALGPARALVARLLLIHHYRLCLQADPRLPAEGLPSDWPGPKAQALFARLYRALSPLAEAHVADEFLAEDGALPRETPVSRERLAQLDG